jgi:hypothetical protein
MIQLRLIIKFHLAVVFSHVSHLRFLGLKLSRRVLEALVNSGYCTYCAHCAQLIIRHCLNTVFSKLLLLVDIHSKQPTCFASMNIYTRKQTYVYNMHIRTYVRLVHTDNVGQLTATWRELHTW